MLPGGWGCVPVRAKLPSRPGVLAAPPFCDPMERLWSPWRAQHVEAFEGDPRADGQTLFARLGASTDDAANLVVWRGQHVFALLNRYPYNNGHLLVVPYRAVADYDALTDDEQVELARTLARAIGWLRAAFAPDGFNVGLNLGEAGGAGLPDHLHLHVVPRWRGDTNFMPVVGEAKVIPESLEATYRKLRSVIGPENPAGESRLDAPR